MTTAFQSNAFQTTTLAFQIDSGPTPPSVTPPQPGGGDSTRLRKRGRRPKYFWEAALAKKEKDKIAEAVFDAVADAYLIESDSEFSVQIKYLRNLEKRFEEARFNEFAHHINLAIKDLAILTQRRDERVRQVEEEELQELLEILG